MNRSALAILQILTLIASLSRASHFTATNAWGSKNHPLAITTHHRTQQPSWNVLDCDRFVNSFLTIRGGEIDLIDNAAAADEDGILIVKTRNIIRSVLDVSEKNLPTTTRILKSLFSALEGITGVKLLPEPEKKKKSKKKSKKSAEVKSSEPAEEEKDEETAKEISSKSKTKSKLKKPSAATKKHLASTIKSTNPNYRIQRELKEFIKSPPPNLSVQVGSNLRVWIITMVGANNTIYEGESFKLRVSFPTQYPTVPPSVYFLQGHIPTHEHVYTNGDICLSLLGKDWRPTMTAQSIAVSILSILSSAQSKSLPMDNARHAGNKPGQYQKDWVYHDDNC
ncbi:unnamed protein product [Cylindrotheca closterium]|uniref:UBC core domain-containing protein n=1 Tax=Cylindrotheca closterium TaxID=2856 RepID=A0AAD2CBB8_9STRA|nr:unnamed protein product [Cylindrotheca closterium]